MRIPSRLSPAPARVGHAWCRAAGLLIAASALLVSCAESPSGPTHVALAAGFRPDAEELDGVLGFWLETEIDAQAWRAGAAPGTWRAADPCAGSGLPFAPALAPRLRVGTRDYRLAATREQPALVSEPGALPPATSPEEPQAPALAAGEFRIGDAEIVLRLLEGDAITGAASLARFVSAGRAVRALGAGARERWRVKSGSHTVDGIPLWTGGAQELTLEADAAELRFATSCNGPASDDEVELRVLVDGELVHGHEQAISRDARPTPHVLAFPERLRRGARVRFEAHGPPALLTLHAPQALAAPGGGAPSPRPDIVVVLADTFRADNLGAYGGEWGVTPHLDALAQESRVFARTWAPSAWTLPSHASLFLGVFPYQHGATRGARRASEELVALAEVLAAGGYRTGAVTDALYVSEQYGMDRGFESFEELGRMDLHLTLRAALDFLDAADGRPSFLFVHSYRVHGPYRVSAQTVREHGDRLGLREAKELRRRAFTLLGESHESRDEGTAELRERFAEHDWFGMLGALEGELGVSRAAVVDALQKLYRGGVADFDRGMGAFLAELEKRERPAGLHLLFTSDHGEAFAEHGTVYHSHGVWDEVLRIPLLWRGPGIEPGVDAAGASLVDLAPSLARAAGLAPHPQWRGRSLLESGADAPVFAYDCARGVPPSAMVVDGAWKLALPAQQGSIEPEQLAHVYDLAQDPSEGSDLAGAPPQQVLEILGRRRSAMSSHLEPLRDAEQATVSEENLRAMRALGYVEDGSE